MEIEKIERQDYTHWELPVFEIDGCQYAVATSEEEADEAAGEYIKDSLWAFNPSFIIQHSKLPWEAEEMVKFFQEKKCENANETIEALIEDMNVFIEDAISVDRRGHFLAPYDRNEISLDDIDFKFWGQILGELGLGTKDKGNLLLYRVN